MERLSKALNVLYNSRKHYESALPDKKSASYEKEKNAILDVKEVLVQKELRKDAVFNEQFARVVEVIFAFVSHRNSDLRLVAEQTLTSILRHMVVESNSSRVIVSLLVELKRNGGARSLVAAFNLLVEFIDSVKPNKTGIVGAHIVGALCSIARRPEDSIQTCLEKVLPRLFSVFVRQFTTHRNEDFSNLYEIALENLELFGSCSRAASMIIYQLSLYFPEVLKKSFKQFCWYLLNAKNEKKNVVVGALNTLKLLWPSIMSRKNQFDVVQLQDVVRRALQCLFSQHNEIVVASLEFLEFLFSNFIDFFNSLPFNPTDELHDTEVVDEQASKAALSESSVFSSASNLDTVGTISGNQLKKNFEGSVPSSDKLFILHDNSKSACDQDRLYCTEADEILDPLRHGFPIPSDRDSIDSDTSAASGNILPRFEVSNVLDHLPTDICSDSLAAYSAALLARRFLLSEQCLRQIPDKDVRVSHKILAMNCLAHLANCLPNFFNISLRSSGKFGTPLLKDIQLFMNHDDDLLKASTVTAIVNASRSAFFSCGSLSHETKSIFKKCLLDVMHLRKAHCSRALFAALKAVQELVCNQGMTEILHIFACECSSDNYFLLRIAIIEYFASVQWASLGLSFPDFLLEVYLKLLADVEPRVVEAAAANFSFFVSSANYFETESLGASVRPGAFICSAFEREPLTIAMGQEYNFIDEAVLGCSENLSLLLFKLFKFLEETTDENFQAGVVAGLASLAAAYPPSKYPVAWGVYSHCESSRVGLFFSLLSQYLVAPLRMSTLNHLFIVLRHLFAGICEAVVLKTLTDKVSLETDVKFLDWHLVEEFILSSIRVLNLYYSITVEYEQSFIAPKPTVLSPTMSPVRKVLNPVSSGNTIEQRIQSITNLTGTGIKLAKGTSFLQAASLCHIADSLRGIYANYMDGLSDDGKEKFASLLVSALRALSCILEMISFSSISSLYKEILFYCRTTIFLAPAETVELVLQMLKVLFGRNAFNLDLGEIKKMLSTNANTSNDLLEKMLLKTANSYTDFVVNSGREETYNRCLRRCAGWLQKELISKARLTYGDVVAENIGLFENFVSRAVRLFQISNSYSFQTSTLKLLCGLIMGGVNFSMLDPKMQLSNSLFNLVNEYGSRNWFNSETVKLEEVSMIRCVFQFFTLVSRIESGQQTFLEPQKLTAFCEVMVGAAIAKPQLTLCALNSLEVVLLESVAVKKRFEQSMERILCMAEPLGRVCPTEYIQIWTLFLYNATVCGEEQRLTKLSLAFFKIFQHLNLNWNMETAFSGMIALRLCSPATFRPIDNFLRTLAEILLSMETSCFERLIYASPYLFTLLCVMDESSLLPHMERTTGLSSKGFAQLLMKLLFGCVCYLRKLTVPEIVRDGSEYCRQITWFLHALSYAIRSGNIKSITSSFAEYIPSELNEVYVLSVLYPHVFVAFLTFYSSLNLTDYSLFLLKHRRDISMLCKLVQFRSYCNGSENGFKKFLEQCSAGEMSIVLSILKSRQFISKLTIGEHSQLCEYFLKHSKGFSSLPCILDVLDSTDSNDMEKKEALSLLICAAKEESYAVKKYASMAPLLPLSAGEATLEQEATPQRALFVNERTLAVRENPEMVAGLFGDTSLATLCSLEPTVFDCDFLCQVILSLILQFGKIITASCVAGSFSRLDALCGEKVLRCAYAAARFDIVTECMDEITAMSAAAFNFGEMYSEYSVVSIQKAENMCHVFVKLAFDPSLYSPVQLLVQCKLAEGTCEAFCAAFAKWAFNAEWFEFWVAKYAELISVEILEAAYIDPVIFTAIAFAISQPSFISAIENTDLKRMVENQLLLGGNINRILESLTRNSSFKKAVHGADKERLNWDIVLRDGSGERFKDRGFFTDSVQTAYQLAVNIQETFRRKLVKGSLAKPLENLAKAITRLPLFNDVACIPRMALLDFSCKWRVELEIRNNSIAVSTVNVHHLCNVDVLRDFMWRLCWAGWNRQTNFNNFTMSLFGVLSSTPSGSELQASSLNVTEQLMASAAAVEGLTNVLLQTVFFPERGNLVRGCFVTKHRETANNFIATKFGQRLCMLKMKLNNSSEMKTIFQRNLDFSVFDAKRYAPGRLSVHAIWSMTGVLDLERNLVSRSGIRDSPFLKKALPTSESAYLLESGHDSTTESCLRMLFDIYSHWFRAGVDAVPLALLSAIIKSMLLLSDLFVELDQYAFVFNNMKSLFFTRSSIENIDLGNIICCILKCFAVLGLEGVSMLKPDAQKLVLNCVECGLTSGTSEVRIRTLQGILYIIQSLSHEELRSILPLIQSFLLSELSLRSLAMDPVNLDAEFESFEYETLVWTLGFALCENLLYSTEDFRTTVLDFVYKAFISPVSPVWLMDLLTSGVEQLVISSHTYIRIFNRVAIKMMKDYFIAPFKFSFALRIGMACLYHGMHEAYVHGVDLQFDDSELYLMEQFPVIFRILAEGSENDALLLLKVLPYLLVDSLNQSEIINNVLKELIHRYPNQPHPRPKAIFTIVYHWFAVLRSRETDAVVNDWILNGLDSFKHIIDPLLFRFYVNAFLCSASGNPYIGSLFHIIINRGRESSWLDDLLFPLIIRSLLLKLTSDSRKQLKSKMEIYIVNGVEYVDSARVRDFPNI